jgi:hypothetical protein
MSELEEIMGMVDALVLSVLDVDVDTAMWREARAALESRIESLVNELEKHRREVAITFDEADSIICELDSRARNVCHYDYGLPMDDEFMTNAREFIMNLRQQIPVDAVGE